MSLTLGEKLRQAREERGMSISEAAEQTRIAPLYLESIENNDYRPLPGGIFNKGFVKSYAKLLGLDEQEALQDYATLISQQGSDVNDDPKTYRPEVLTDEHSRSGLLPTVIFSVIIVGIIVWAAMAVLKYYNENNNQPLSETNVNKSSNANVAVTPTPTPAIATDQINVDFKPLKETVSLSYWLDGKQTNKSVTTNETLSLNPQESVKFRYYRGFTPDKIQLTVNGKHITPPNPPAKGIAIEFEINKNNIQQILQNGSADVPATTSGATAQTTTTPANVQRPVATPTRPPQTPKPSPAASTTPANAIRPAGNTNTRQ